MAGRAGRWAAISNYIRKHSTQTKAFACIRVQANGKQKKNGCKQKQTKFKNCRPPRSETTKREQKTKMQTERSISRSLKIAQDRPVLKDAAGLIGIPTCKQRKFLESKRIAYTLISGVLRVRHRNKSILHCAADYLIFQEKKIGWTNGFEFRMRVCFGKRAFVEIRTHTQRKASLRGGAF